MWDTIIADEIFQTSFRVFYALQEWGAEHLGEENTEMEIGTILVADRRWTDLNDSDRRRVGKFIAHYFPQLAAMCTIPIYIVLDAKRTDERGNKGTYRLTWY